MITKTEIEESLPEGFEPAIELAGNLAFYRHEGSSKGFAFLVGTDAVWPGIAEVLSADFGIPDDYHSRNKDRLLFDESDMKFGGNNTKEMIELMKTICESNYSIFQIFGATGFYNTGSRRFVNIVRLQQPAQDGLLRGKWITDLDDLYCSCLDKIWEETKGVQKSCIVSTEGDGKIRVYAIDENNKADLFFMWDAARDKVYRPISKNIKTMLTELFGENEGSSDLMRVIRKISTAVGEGAMLIMEDQRNARTRKYLAPMEYIKPEWQRNLGIQVPKELLRSAFVMDGATLIAIQREETSEISPKSDVKIEPRYVVYPFAGSPHSAYGLLKLLSNKWQDDREAGRKVVKKLSGKGSKTHGAANLSYLLNPEANKDLKIITISADGPITLWPDGLFNEED